MTTIDLTIQKDRRERAVQRARETQDCHPHLCPDERSCKGTSQGKGIFKECWVVGCGPAQPVPDHLA